MRPYAVRINLSGMMRIEDDDLTLLIARTWSAGDHVQHDQSPNGEKAVESGDARASHCPLTLMVFFSRPPVWHRNCTDDGRRIQGPPR